MEYKVVWTDRARFDLRDIVEYIAARDVSAAKRIGDGIFDCVQILETFPSIGPAFPRSMRSPLREILFRNYRIFYEVNQSPKNVTILHIRHGSRDEPEF